jgi:hypothetical protein
MFIWFLLNVGDRSNQKVLSSDPNINAILFTNATAIIEAAAELPLLLRALLLP